jgi:3-phosphoshikimate 1-carboxyvinyltransferase
MPDPIVFRVPGSKSQTQRALILASLAQGESRIIDPLDCDDSQSLCAGLRSLGTEIEEQAQTWIVCPRPLQPPDQPIYCQDAGTTLRFLTPLCLLLDGELILDGSPRLRQRPLSDLIRALEKLGVQVRQLEQESTLPLGLRSAAQPAVDEIEVDTTLSSQFASGLLMVAPRLPRGLCLRLTSTAASGPVSVPYLTMTLQAMADFGVTVEQEPDLLRVPAAPYSACDFQVEADWSSASFLLAGGMISNKQVRLENLNPDSVQGDRAISDFIEELGRDRPHRFDLTHCPDLIAPLAAACVFARNPSEIVNVSHARHKESDRVAVLARQFQRAGIQVEERADGMLVHPSRIKPALLDPHGDHRMAMAFGLLSLVEPNIQISDPGCVSKSFPDFWQQLERLR